MEVREYLREEFLEEAALGIVDEAELQHRLSLFDNAERTVAAGKKRKDLKPGEKDPNQIVSTDPDAGWNVRPGSHNPDVHSESEIKEAGGRLKFGYDLTTLIAGEVNTGGKKNIPSGLVMGMHAAAPGRDPGNIATDIVRNVRKRGYPAGWLAGDRLYAPGQSPDVFQIPAQEELGYKLAMDYGLDDAGPHPEQGQDYRGFVPIEGQFYCPAMPKVLHQRRTTRR